MPGSNGVPILRSRTLCGAHYRERPVRAGLGLHRSSWWCGDNQSDFLAFIFSLCHIPVPSRLGKLSTEMRARRADDWKWQFVEKKIKKKEDKTPEVFYKQWRKEGSEWKEKVGGNGLNSICFY